MVSSSCWPRTPPAALRSATAISAPRCICSPNDAYWPVIGPAVAILICAWAAPAPSATPVAASIATRLPRMLDIVSSSIDGDRQASGAPALWARVRAACDHPVTVAPRPARARSHLLRRGDHATPSGSRHRRTLQAPTHHHEQRIDERPQQDLLARHEVAEPVPEEPPAQDRRRIEPDIGFEQAARFSRLAAGRSDGIGVGRLPLRSRKARSVREPPGGSHAACRPTPPTAAQRPSLALAAGQEPGALVEPRDIARPGARPG